MCIYAHVYGTNISSAHAIMPNPPTLIWKSTCERLMAVTDDALLSEVQNINVRRRVENLAKRPIDTEQCGLFCQPGLQHM